MSIHAERRGTAPECSGMAFTGKESRGAQVG